MGKAHMTAHKTRRAFSLRQRALLCLVTWAGNVAIRLVGRTLRLRVSLAQGALANPPHNPSIYCMWHRCVVAAAYAYRNQALRVMISRSFDGEIIARLTQKLGYVPVRGSSSSGGAGALLELHDEIARGASAVFTVDGPRGPRYVAKPGAVRLSANTGAPIVAYHFALERAWILRSWDGLMIPKPFTRGVLRLEAPFSVPAGLDDSGILEYAAELQRRMDRAREVAEQIANSGKFEGLAPLEM
ncbi:MAG: lysophospholipid acyltransferase family protein [Acidobacteria bacterium]|nr:lysophospholipid acyltransferase family protein [Acidobacteriota bacterium]